MVHNLVIGSLPDAPRTVSLDVAPGTSTITSHRIEQNGNQPTGAGAVIWTEIGIAFKALELEERVKVDMAKMTTGPLQTVETAKD
jgi:hypothetical protein